MEHHAAGNAGIEQLGKNVPLVVRDAQDINLLITDILVQMVEQMVFIDERITDFQVGILLLEVLLDTGQFDFVPSTPVFLRVEMDKGNRKMIRIERPYQRIERHQVALVEVGNQGHLMSGF